jgi:hypothetical protein
LSWYCELGNIGIGSGDLPAYGDERGYLGVLPLPVPFTTFSPEIDRTGVRGLPLCLLSMVSWCTGLDISLFSELFSVLETRRVVDETTTCQRKKCRKMNIALSH